ncbi:tRNA lysidine(34) synthetase TilS [Bacillus sp. Marseille-P3661]|uniref:tRNA lysidine(34) synthetase TilS n=1 Tax=Bacillus sp. Marseille-P3661 TaxID=1936234 RepID=UPI000C846FC5|nr:tRNA lysidine(34) synthetase TilS [Bacillus sp. Marseille-P3661]
MKLEKVDHFINSYNLLEKGSTIIVGVSGGIDSIALLHYLWTKREIWSLKIVVAHVDHMFRGQQSKDDLLFVQDYCKKLNIEFEGVSMDVPEFAAAKQISSQAAARECRYEFYKTVIHKYHGRYLALAHHGDDQIETMLMRMVRGSYGQAVAGIPLKRPFEHGMIIRPFLCLTKSEIEQYVVLSNLSYREDPSNEKDDYQRNRFRHHVLPFLRKENPNVAERFQTLSQMLTEDHQLLERLAEEELAKCIIHKEEMEIIFSINVIISLPISLQRRCIQLILNYLYKDIPSNVTTIHINQVLSLLDNDHPSGQLNFPKGLIVRRSYQQCSMAFEKKMQNVDSYYYNLSIPGEILVNGKYLIEAEWVSEVPEKVKGMDYFLCDSKGISLPLHIRTRRQGDRMTLSGMKGTKKIKTIFIDEKIPRELRDSWPIVEDSNGCILWLPQLKKSADFIGRKDVVDGTDHQYLLLQFHSYNE